MTILPGPWIISKTDYVEDSGETGCLRIIDCYVRIDPRDDAYNLVREPGLILVGEYQILL